MAATKSHWQRMAPDAAAQAPADTVASLSQDGCADDRPAASGVARDVAQAPVTAPFQTSPSVSTSIPRAPRIPKLDARLRAAADWVTSCDVCADIGCDHGRLGATLLHENRCKRLLAADISAAALDKAVVRLKTLGLSDRAEFIVADGLTALEALPDGRADTICVLGMGGATVAGILQRGQPLLQGATLILGAQTELFLAREALQQIGYRLTDERVINAEDKLYLLMRAVPAAGEDVVMSERDCLLGPCLLKNRPPEWKPWLIRRQKLLTQAVAAMRDAALTRDENRLAKAERELLYIGQALCELETPRAPGEN